MKVKIFSENGRTTLENEVNNFLEHNNSENIVDIKYTIAVNNSTKTNFPFIFSAMIILK